MINEKLKRMAIILLITIFSIVGIVSCSADITEPSESIELPDPDNTGPTTPDEPEPTFPGDTYYNVYTPFVKDSSEDAAWITVVSYQDTNTLTQVWKDIIDGGKDNDGKRWFIRDGDNRAKVDDPSIRERNHYYYFDKNFDLVYHRQGKGTLKIRKLVGAVIVKYYRGSKADTYTVAGLYQNLIDNAGQYNWMHFSKFMHAGYNPDGNEKRKVGDLELLVLNVGFGGNGEYGVDAYYNVWNRGGWRDNIEYFLGRSPDFVDNRDPKNYALNQKVNHTYDTAAFNFKFVSLQPEAWHLEEHPEGDWVQR